MGENSHWTKPSADPCLPLNPQTDEGLERERQKADAMLARLCQHQFVYSKQAQYGVAYASKANIILLPV
jgi:hypothetical protein